MAEGYRRRRIDYLNDLTALAWNTAALSRQKTLPELKTLLIDDDPKPDQPKQQTTEEMIAMARMITLAYGGEIVEV